MSFYHFSVLSCILLTTGHGRLCHCTSLQRDLQYLPPQAGIEFQVQLQWSLNRGDATGQEPTDGKGAFYTFSVIQGGIKLNRAARTLQLRLNTCRTYLLFIVSEYSRKKSQSKSFTNQQQLKATMEYLLYIQRLSQKSLIFQKEKCNMNRKLNP